MADFPTSTHCDHWILSQHELIERSRAANDRACQALQTYGATRVEVQQDGSLAYPGLSSDLAGGENGRGPSPVPLSLEEESQVQRFYEVKIQQVCAAFKFPNKIQATAILYFKRFYLNWSVMEHDPKHIMLTCIYVACKVEEWHVSAEEFGKGIKQDPQVVLKNEMTVLQGLNFDLIVYVPYRALDGYIFDLRSSAARPDGIQELRDAAGFTIDAMMLTDAPLLFPPGQMALAALRSANREERKVDLETYMTNLVQTMQSRRTYADLTNALDMIDMAVMNVKPTGEADARRIDRKLKICRNPGLQDESKKQGGHDEGKKRKGKHKQKRTQGQDLSNTLDGSEVADMDTSTGHGLKRRHNEAA